MSDNTTNDMHTGTVGISVGDDAVVATANIVPTVIPTITIPVMDHTIPPETYQSYIRDLLPLLRWIHSNNNNEIDWLTDYGKERLTSIFDGETHNNQPSLTMMNEFQQALHNASTQPIIHLNRIVPFQFIQFIRAEYFTNNTTSISSSNGAATSTTTTPNMERYKKPFFDHQKDVLCYLFRLHNGKGFHGRRAFAKELTDCLNYLFLQQVVRQHKRNIQNNNNNNNDMNLLDNEYFNVLDHGGVMTEAMMEDSMQQEELYRNELIQEKMNEVKMQQELIRQEQQNFKEQMRIMMEGYITGQSQQQR